MTILEYIKILPKPLEYIGVGFAAVGFGMLANNMLLFGFVSGTLSCICLIPYFHVMGQKGLFSLQIYFLCANILGMYNNWGM